MVLAGCITGLADRYAQSGRMQHELGNGRGPHTGRERDRAPQRLAKTHQLIEINCTTWILGDRPVTDRNTQNRHINLVEEVAELGNRWRTPEPNAQRFGEHGWWRMANRSRSHKLWQPLRIPRSATCNKYQAGKRKPRRIRASGIDVK
jgi:hypothetical protein